MGDLPKETIAVSAEAPFPARAVLNMPANGDQLHLEVSGFAGQGWDLRLTDPLGEIIWRRFLEVTDPAGPEPAASPPAPAG